MNLKQELSELRQIAQRNINPEKLALYQRYSDDQLKRYREGWREFEKEIPKLVVNMREDAALGRDRSVIESLPSAMQVCARAGFVESAEAFAKQHGLAVIVRSLSLEIVW